MSRWFYAVLKEPAGHYGTAVKATNLMYAKRQLRRRYPHAIIISITAD